MALLGPTTTGSILEGLGGKDRTGTAISTNIVIKVGALAIGAIQSISINESRQIQMIDEVGTDGHIDSVPFKSTDISGEITRIRFDRMRAFEALGRGFIHIHAQRIPFDIDIYDTFNGDGSSSIVTTIKNVWFNKIGYTYRADNWIITEDIGYQAEAISSTLNGSNAAQGGERGANIISLNSIERSSDVGKNRGSLTAPGILNDFFSNA